MTITEYDSGTVPYMRKPIHPRAKKPTSLPPKKLAPIEVLRSKNLDLIIELDNAQELLNECRQIIYGMPVSSMEESQRKNDLLRRINTALAKIPVIPKSQKS